MSDILKSNDIAESYLASIVESSDDAIIGKTLDGIILSWNSAAEHIFGYSASEAIGQHITLIIPKDRIDEEFIIIGKIKAGERLDHFETVRQTKDGTLIDLSLTVSPIRDNNGKVIGASKVARDIRQQKAAERATAYLGAIIDSSDDAIVSKDLNGVITSWNKSAERIFGYTAEEAVGQHINLLIPLDKREEEYIILGKIKSGERVDHFETLRQTKSGRQVKISLTVSPIIDSHGRIIGASKVARDITQQREIELALLESNQRKDEFLANISHELRTPMNAVIGLANIIGMSPSLTEKEKQYVGTLKQSADHLLALINNLLDYSKIESNSLEFEAVEFDLYETLQKPIELLNIRAKEKELDLVISYGLSLKKFYIGDPLRIQQILINLLSNAIKFTERGSISVSVTNVSETEVTTVLSISIQDTGIGIPQDKLSIIFDKFTQVDASTTRKYGGSGLGLSICRSFVNKMGGTISAKSEVGLGTTFTVELPLQNSNHDLELKASDLTPISPKKNVLIVEDYEPNLLVISATLDMLGYTYDSAINGLEAIRKYQQGHYEVILMDVQMHEMDGFESTRWIRAYEQKNDVEETPIIAITAHVSEKDRNKCIDAGMNDFVPKPFDPAVLTKLLKKHIKSVL